MPYPSTVIAYEGASQLTGEPIVLILTNLERPSSNIKTGHMVQAVVLDASLKPTQAVLEGTDENVCGNCPLRKGVCYVNLVPWNNVYQNYINGKIPHLTQADLERAQSQQKRLRMTAYGDPAAVPIEVWENLLQYFSHWTGYSHQWRQLDSRWSRFLMASCETTEDVLLARSRGWSTFRVRSEGAPRLTDIKEIECPNVSNSAIQCASCRLCSGTPSPSTLRSEGSGSTESKTRHISIEVHGLDWKVSSFHKLATASN